MKEHPLLLSSPMVLATLAGIKHVTRRIPSPHNTLIDGKPWGKSKCKWQDMMAVKYGVHIVDGGLRIICSRCGNRHFITPIYQPGDVVWFKETWRTDSSLDELGPSKFCKWPVKYLADGAILNHGAFHGNTEGKTRVSIHMPKWASRLRRPIIGSRIERLGDITEEHAIAEGMREPSLRDLHPTLAQAAWSERQVFSRLWNLLNAERDGGIYAWSNNPLVIVIEFGLGI